jgi:hypothetical protein
LTIDSRFIEGTRQLEQGVVNVAAERDHERPGHLGLDALQHASAGAAQFASPGRKARRADRRSGAELVERVHGVGSECQRKPQIAWSVRAFVDAHVPAMTTQADRGGQATDTGAGDERGAGRLHATRTPPAVRS